MTFSGRTGWEFAPNALAVAVAERRRRGEPILDWTLSNPTQCGFSYPAEEILAALASPGGLRYDPDPQGLREARETICDWYGRKGIALEPESLFLTAGSSEAYSWLFRLLCESGDEVLIPKPGYPLFDDLARLNDVHTVPYRYRYDGSWHLDLETVRRGITGRTRAIVLIHPNNPTGNYLSRVEIDELCLMAAMHDLALISDEVFWSFPFRDVAPVASLLDAGPPLTFVINGISKLAGLPQMKLGWIALSRSGPSHEAARRLAMIGDTYLSVNTPVQAGLRRILDSSSGVSEAIRRRAAKNYAEIGRRLEGMPISLLASEGGWSAIFRMPGHSSDDDWTLRLMQEFGLLTYPGHFFDLEGGVFLVVSLIVEEGKTSDYLDRILTVS